MIHDDFISKTKMDDFDKEQVDRFMNLVHRTLYTCIAKHEEQTGKPFEVRDDADMEILEMLSHQSINLTMSTLNALHDKHIEVMK